MMGSGAHYEFRERSVGEIARECVRLLWSHLPVLVAPAALTVIAFTLLAEGLVARLEVDWKDPDQAARARGVLQLVVSLGSFLAAPMVVVALGEICAGRRPAFEAVWVGGLRAAHRVAWTTLVAIPALALGLLLVVLPGLYLGIAWYLIYPAVVLEGLSGPRALGRSFDLMEGHIWRGAGVVACGLLALVPTALLSGYGAALVPSIGSAVATGGAAVGIAIGQVLAVLLYLDIRVRKEQLGFDAFVRSRPGSRGSFPASVRDDLGADPGGAQAAADRVPRTVLRPATRWRRPAALALCGFGAAVLAYAAFELPLLGLSAWLRNALIALSVVPLFVARGLARGAPDGPRWSIAALAGLAGAAVGIASAYAIAPPLAQVRLSAHSLPGLSVPLPSGPMDLTGGYAAGRAIVTQAGGFDVTVAVEWQVGPQLSHDEQLHALSVGLAAGGLSGARSREGGEVVIGEGSVHVDRLVAGAVNVWAAHWPCGGRVVGVLVYSELEGAGGLHRRILEGLQCRPDSEEATVATPPVAVDLPAGWTTAPSDPGVTAFAGSDGMLIVSYFAPSTRGATLAKLLPGMGQVAGSVITITGEERREGREVVRGTWEHEGETMAMLALVLPCGGSRPDLLVIYLHPPSLAPDPGFVFAARCTQPGEALPSYPAPPAP